MTTPDQGLAAILKECACQDNVVNYLKEGCGVANTSDFLSYFGRSAYEAEIAELFKAKFPISEEFPLERQKLCIARCRSAYALAVELVDQLKAEANKPSEDLHPDLDRPLDEKTVKELDARWDAMHPFKFIAAMKGAPPFRARIFREIRTKTLKLVPVEKVKSVEDYKTVHEPTSLPIGGSQADGGRLVYEVTKKANRTVSTVLEYFTALRILMRTYSFCGSHTVDATGEALLGGAARKVVFFSYGAAITYIDELTTSLLAMQFSMESEKLTWVRYRDETIRTEWVNLVNEGIPGDEALATAVSKHKHLFNMRDSSRASGFSEAIVPYTEPRGQRRPRDEPQGGKGQGKNKKGKGQEGSLRRASQTENRIKLCGAYNSPKGCVDNDRNCPQKGRHWCSIILADGTVCKAKDHCAITHFTR